MKLKDIDSGVASIRLFNANEEFLGYYDLEMLQKFLPDLEVILDFSCDVSDVILSHLINKENVSRETNRCINAFLPQYRKKIIFLNIQWLRRDVPIKLINRVLLKMLEVHEVDNDVFEELINKMFVKEAMSVYESI